MLKTNRKWIKPGWRYPDTDPFHSIGFNVYGDARKLEIILYHDTFTAEIRDLATVLTEMADEIDQARAEEGDDATEEG